MKPLLALSLLTLTLCGPSLAHAKGRLPEDLLKGQMIITDQRLPTHWDSVASYVKQLKKMNKTTLWYDEKSGQLTVQYAAFFAQPVNDVQVDLVIYDVTGHERSRKASTEQFMSRGERALFNSVLFDKRDFDINRKYRLVIESRRKPIAWGEFTLRGEGPHYSGKVNFSDDEAK